MKTTERIRTSHRALGHLVDFGFVGSVGFVIDATLLTVLVHGFSWGHYQARLVSFSAAVTTTWLANRRWVFNPSCSARREYLTYVGVQVIGAALNLLVYVSLIEVYANLSTVPVIPLGISALVVLIFNYWAVATFVFRPHIQSPPT